jgi:hypothetical protein
LESPSIGGLIVPSPLDWIYNCRTFGVSEPGVDNLKIFFWATGTLWNLLDLFKLVEPRRVRRTSSDHRLQIAGIFVVFGDRRGNLLQHVVGYADR